MVKGLSIFALVLLSLPSQVIAASHPQSQIVASDLYRSASPSVVLIETYGDDGKVAATGSGFLVGASGEILTNYHVIAHTKRATVRLANDDAYDDVLVLDIDKRKDIALIKIKAVGLPFLKLGRSGSVQIGDKLYALGNPLGVFQNTFSDGILSGIRQMDGYKLFQLSAPISRGSSGSPVFNSTGEVVGIIESTVEEGQNINFAVPIDYAIGMLDSKQTQSLESIYEPEENAPAATEVVQQTSAPTPSEALKSDIFTYVGTKIGIWTKEDAEIELGPSIDRRDLVLNNAVTGDIYKYKCPPSGFGTVELSIDRNSKKLTAAYFYYASVVTWSAVRQKLGKNYKKIKLQNGRPGYLYQFQNRQVFIVVDSADNVFNIGEW
jgi:Trypsin-like peptidase domain